MTTEIFEQLVENEQSVSLKELTRLLDLNLVTDSVVGSETINGVRTESRTVNISPVLANTLLNRNNHNRPLTRTNITKISNAMTNGEWVFDGTPISFDKYGNLLNGQHRLSSVIKSGKSNIFKVATGFKPDVFSTMDIGQTRTGADVLAIDGVENYKLVAKTANFIYKFIQGSIGESAVSDSAKHRNAGTQLSHPELIKFVSVKPLLHESVLFQMKTKKLQPTSIIPNYMVSGLYFLFAEKDKDAADVFLRRLVTGESLSLTSPIFHLRNRLLNSKTDRNKRLLHNEVVKLTVFAWNKFRKGDNVKQLQIPETLPVII